PGDGRGTYGYSYNRGTGKREIDPEQAEVVARIFRRYRDTRSFGTVSIELNEDRIPAFAGGRWYPLTIRRILSNESYAGRLMFRRTQWVTHRNASNGKLRRKPMPRPEEDWIDVTDASPRIVEESLWQQVQEILADPVR